MLSWFQSFFRHEYCTTNYTAPDIKNILFLTGGVGVGHRAGHRHQEEEDRQLHGVVLLARLCAPAASFATVGCSAGEEQSAHTEAEAPRFPSTASGKQAFYCRWAKSRDPLRGRVWPLSVHCGSGRGVTGSGCQRRGGGRGGEGRREVCSVPGWGWGVDFNTHSKPESFFLFSV